jgi:hypothetical protein
MSRSGAMATSEDQLRDLVERLRKAVLQAEMKRFPRTASAAAKAAR